MKKLDKKEIVKNVAEDIKSSAAVVLIDYSGMNVKLQQELKNRLHEVGARMVVVKNTLLKIAGNEAKVDKEMLTDTVLSGQTALIIGAQDPVAPIQVLGKFVKEFELPQLKVGLVEGNFQDKEGLVRLSTLPSKEVLIGQALGAIAAPMYGIVSTLQSKMQELIYVLEQASNGGE